MGSIQEFGLGLIRSGHGSTSAIQKSLTQLEEAKFELDQAWLKRRTTLEQARTLQVTRVQRLYAGDQGSTVSEWISSMLHYTKLNQTSLNHTPDHPDF